MLVSVPGIYTPRLGGCAIGRDATGDGRGIGSMKFRHNIIMPFGKIYSIVAFISTPIMLYLRK